MVPYEIEIENFISLSLEWIPTPNPTCLFFYFFKITEHTQVTPGLPMLHIYFDKHIYIIEMEYDAHQHNSLLQNKVVTFIHSAHLDMFYTFLYVFLKLDSIF